MTPIPMHVPEQTSRATVDGVQSFAPAQRSGRALRGKFSEEARRAVHRLAWTALMAFAVAAKATEALTIATYNVENYGPADRVTAEGFRPAYPKPETEKQALRQVIRGLNADVLVLQEMGAQPYLDELRRDLKAEGCDYPHAALSAGPDLERHVAILSRRPLVHVATVAELSFPYFGGRERVKRGLLEARIATAAGDVTVFAFHLKSRYTERADDPQCEIQRTGEATAIRDAVLGRFPDPASARFILLGDANDTKASKPLERLQKRGDVTISQLLAVADPRGEAWTYYFRKEDSYARVDHILVSPALRPAVVGGNARIYAGDGVLQASDHRPVCVRLELPVPDGAR